MTTKPWLDLYPAEISKTLDYEKIPLQEFLTRSATKYPEKTQCIFLGKISRYKEFHESALKFANYLTIHWH